MTVKQEKTQSLDLLQLTYRIVIDPNRTFQSLRGDVGYKKPLTLMLVFGWVTAILSGIFSLYGVDYTNPSNAGGSAQLFAPWFIKNYIPDIQGVAYVTAFSSLVMVGYIILTALSMPILAFVARMIRGRGSTFSIHLSSAFKAIVYGMTPGFLFGWVPNPLFLVGLWATLWQALAVKEIFELGYLKTVIVVLCWILIVGLTHDAANHLWISYF